MIVALAGRRIDRADAARPQFPLSQVEAVRKRLRDLFVDESVHAMVASAACGADLLALEVANQLGVRRRIVLPLMPDEFRCTSVVDRPGDWGPLFDAQIADAQTRDDLVLLDQGTSNHELYALTNKRLLAELEDLVRDEPGEQPTAVVVWEGASRGAGDFTAQFAELARGQGIPVREVSTRE
jgi:hypothetical protein